ncbi:MAG TPA: hypothetical protein VIM70_05315 [Clostridium sp.]|uniref:hypothetical protein n=1 Tax=Clostridium sp. TaxID=1506 RepID=UPI002F927152
MKEISAPFAKFKFEIFVNKMVTFAEKTMDSDYAVAWIDKAGGFPGYDVDKKERDYQMELKEEGKMLYFYFSDVDSGDPINCANGKKYTLDKYSNFSLSVSTTIGYLLKYKDGEIIINSAMNSGEPSLGPLPSIDLYDDCDVFDEPMGKYIKKFIEK